MTDSGIRIVKLFLNVSKEEQLQRFEARLKDPLKRWKLSYEDFRNRDKWDEYVAAIEEMFERTDVETAPWHVIPSDHKAAARVEAMRIIVDRLAEGIDTEEIPIDPKILDLAKRYLSNKKSG